MKQTKRMVGWLVAGTAALSLGLVPLAAADPGTLSENESAELSFMREEERLARDLYQAFADKYDGARPFSMIVKAEQKRHDAVGTLMTRYDVADSSAGLPAGDYAFDALDELYQTWYAQGSASIESAYQVGVDLETRDIADLKEAIAAATQDDVKATLERLLSGSENHLAAFEKAVDGQVGTGTQAGQQAGRGGKGMAGGGQQAQQGPMDGTGTGTPQGQQAGRGAGTQAQQGPMDGTGPMAGTEDCPAVS